MKLVMAMFVVGTLACGGKGKAPATTSTTETQNMTQGTGGTTYGGGAYGGAAAPTK
jgi:hypothetical protein